MSRGVWIRFFLVLGLLVGCVALAVNVKPNLGLDLKGGAQFVFQAEGTEETPANAENVDKTLERARAAASTPSVSPSPTLVRQGEDRILVELPGVTSDEEAQDAEEKIGQTAKLTIHEVARAPPSPTPKPSKKDNQVLPSDQGDTLEVGPTVIQGDEITGASAVQRDQSVEWVVAIDFNGKGGDTWADITGKAACNPSGDPKRRIAIVLDGEIISSPEVNTGVGCDVGIRGGSTDITGNFTRHRRQGPGRADRGRLAAARADRHLRPPRRPLAGCRGDRRLDRGRHHRPDPHRPVHRLRLPPRRPDGHDRAGVVRPAGLRHARRPRLDADPARPRRLRARDRHGDRRQRARLRESAGGVRRLSLRGPAPRARRSASTRRGARSSTPTSPRCSPPACCSSSAPGPIKGFGVTLSIGVIASMVSALIIARVLCDLAVANKPVEPSARRSAASATSAGSAPGSTRPRPT